MRNFPVPSLALVAMLALVTACDSGTTDLDEELTPEEAEFLAVETDEMLNSLLGDQLTALGDQEVATSNGLIRAAFEPVVTRFEFERTRPCRAGGSVVATGTGTHTHDRETQTKITDFEGHKSIIDCARTRGDLVLTVNGEGSFQGHRMKVAGEWSGLQTNDQEGTLTFSTSDGRIKECTYEIHRVADPEAGTITITGHICDKVIDKTMEWDG